MNVPIRVLAVHQKINGRDAVRYKGWRLDCGVKSWVKGVLNDAWIAQQQLDISALSLEQAVLHHLRTYYGTNPWDVEIVHFRFEDRRTCGA